MIYKAKAGYRWDQISMEVYGQPDQYHRIIAANIAVPGVSDMVEAGCVISTAVDLTIPELPVDSGALSELPPWRFVE